MDNLKELFDELLDWLDSDREVAGQKYETIRSGLVRIFVSHGISDGAFYADETIDRVIRRLPEIKPTFVGEPARYFSGVARKVLFEAIRKDKVVTDVIPERATEEAHNSEMFDCLRECLEHLPLDRQELILDYHLYQGRAKVEHHREMAAELSISEGALRTRAHHLRVNLEKCVLECLEGSVAKQKSPSKS